LPKCKISSNPTK